MTPREIAQILSDPIAFISRLQIVDKTGKSVRLKPNDEQIKIIEALLEDDDLLILKGRQIGSSTIVSAFLFWKCYTSPEPITIAILSHKLASSKHLLNIHKTFYNGLPNFLKRPLSVLNTTEMRFEDSGAGIIAVSAEGKGGLRSFTCSYLQISEYAFAPNPEELKATALSALNNGQLIIESTANFFNDALHQEVMSYERGEAKWKYLFFPWFEHKGYAEKIPKKEMPVQWTEVEEDLREEYDLSDEQLWWRRNKLGKMGNKQKFAREYPACIEDAYSVAGNVYLQRDDFDDIEIVQIDPIETTVLTDVDPQDRYAIGVDVAAGVGQDWSVIYVVSKKTNSIALCYRSNEIAPAYLAERIVDFASTYNNAHVLVESNNFGNVVLNEMHHMGYSKIWKDEKGRDWITTLKSKTEMFENLKGLIQNGYISMLDNIVYSELRAITVNDRGGIELKYLDGAHSDNSVALALAYMALDKVNLPQQEFLPQWIKERKAKKIVDRGGVAIASKRRY
jgi:gamma-glutamylcyclotransferase (GGCT)/AIG2-like uncharacterized protein YtfP